MLTLQSIYESNDAILWVNIYLILQCIKVAFISVKFGNLKRLQSECRRNAYPFLEASWVGSSFCVSLSTQYETECLPVGPKVSHIAVT